MRDKPLSLAGLLVIGLVLQSCTVSNTDVDQTVAEIAPSTISAEAVSTEVKQKEGVFAGGWNGLANAAAFNGPLVDGPWQVPDIGPVPVGPGWLPNQEGPLPSVINPNGGGFISNLNGTTIHLGEEVSRDRIQALAERIKGTLPIGSCLSIRMIDEADYEILCGGKPIDVVDATFMGNLQWFKFDRENGMTKYAAARCGGTYLGGNWFLTAAHCLWKKRKKDGTFTTMLVVQLGVNDRSKPISATGKDRVLPLSPQFGLSLPKPIEIRREFPVDLVIVHRRYETAKNGGGTYKANADIALLRIKAAPGDIENRVIIPVRLNTQASSPQDVDKTPANAPAPYKGTTVSFLGWGKTITEGSSTDKLLRGTEYVVPVERCQPSGDPRSSQIICAGNSAQVQCSGDSGGPLLLQDDLGRTSQIGIISLEDGTDCADIPYQNPITPGVFMHTGRMSKSIRISSYIEWINRAKQIAPPSKAFSYICFDLENQSDTSCPARPNDSDYWAYE